MLKWNTIAVAVYNKIPKTVQNSLGKLPILKNLRDSFLRKGTTYREAIVTIERPYFEYVTAFKFVASIKVASSAKYKGIENTVLHNSLTLIKKYKKLKDAATVIDIGANFGYLSLVWSETISKKGFVFSFEPNKHIYTSFMKSIHLNNKERCMRLENLALGNANETINIFLDELTSNVKENPNQKLEAVPVEMVRLDDYLNSQTIRGCDLIKIDVDGIELEILKGSLETIKTYQPILIVETNDDRRIIDFFKPLNYTILDMDLQVYDGLKPLPLNIFCVPNEITL